MPEHCTQVAHLDLTQARQFPWFVALKTKFVPVQFYRFENFISSPALGLGNEIKSLYWANIASDAKSAGGVLGVATGEFDRQTAESGLAALKSVSYEYNGYRLYATSSDFGDANLWFAFLDSHTVAFGPRGVMEQSIRVGAGIEPNVLQNAKLIELLLQQDNDDVFWSISTAEAARSAWRLLLLPVGGIPAADHSVASITSFEIRAKGDWNSELDLFFAAATSAPENALALSSLLQAGLALKQFQVAETNTDVAKILSNFGVSTNGNRLTISIPLKNDDVAALVQHDDLLVPAR